MCLQIFAYVASQTIKPFSWPVILNDFHVQDQALSSGLIAINVDITALCIQHISLNNQVNMKDIAYWKNDEQEERRFVKPYCFHHRHMQAPVLLFSIYEVAHILNGNNPKSNVHILTSYL